MSIEPQRLDAYPSFTTWNAAAIASVASGDGKTIFLNGSVGGAVWLTTQIVPVVPGEQITVSLNLTVPPAYAGGTYRFLVEVWVGATLAVTRMGPTATLAPGQSWSAELGSTITIPAGASTARITVQSTSAAAANRALYYSSTWLRRFAAADEIVSASVERDLARTAETSGTGGLILTQGPVPARRGQITYLCSGWATVAALDALYRGGPVTIPAVSTVLPEYTHYAVGLLRATTERAIPGRPARWLVTIDTRETT